MICGNEDGKVSNNVTQEVHELLPGCSGVSKDFKDDGVEN